MKHLLCWITWITCLKGAFSARDLTPSQLQKQLFQDYNPKVIPIKSPGEKVSVKVGMTLLSIRELDEEKEILKLETWIIVAWNDSYLTWDASDGSIENLNIPNREVWKPDISLYTGSSGKNVLLQADSNVILNNTGWLLWVPPFTISSTCPLDLTDYPDDIQQCVVKLGPWTYGSKSIDLQMYTDDISLTYFVDSNPHWSLKSITVSKIDKYYECCPDEFYSHLEYTLSLERKESVSVRFANSVSCFAMFLALLIFWLPPDSVYKIVLGAISVLLLGFVSLYVGAVLPSSGEQLKANEKIYPLMCIVGVFLVVEIMITNIARMTSSYEVPQWLLIPSKSFCQPFQFCISRLSSSSSDTNEDAKTQKDAEEGRDTRERGKRKHSADAGKENQWKLAAMAIDRMCFFVAIIIIIFFYKVL